VKTVNMLPANLHHGNWLFPVVPVNAQRYFFEVIH